MEVWLKVGDRNTCFFFFHKMANAHCRNNHMGRIKVDGCGFLMKMRLKRVCR